MYGFEEMALSKCTLEILIISAARVTLTKPLPKFIWQNEAQPKELADQFQHASGEERWQGMQAIHQSGAVQA
ncbi:MAG: hypothetical protein AUG51_19910 [Acidobacteria bacterium 13_1_20CM_3_53_8]|nr:MAG: hypothetical protein AUG51_19910 [Acidobacteria bacterium 13_1_20CM_3_53_8]